MADLDIAAFLRDRYDEAENGGKPDRHTADCGYTQIEFVSDECTCGVPAFVLADVAAKRQILHEHLDDGTWKHAEDGSLVRAGPLGDRCSSCLDDGPLAAEAGNEFAEMRPYPCRTVRLLALPYAGHPDYDESWKP